MITNDMPHVVFISAFDSETPRDWLQYSWRFDAISSITCVGSQPPLGWASFPPGDAPLPIELFMLGGPYCRFRFTLYVRNHAGNIGTTYCEIMLL